jgi:DNA-binding CsgD family transcriptional regulator
VVETADAKVARWLGIVSDLLCEPLPAVPYLDLCEELHTTFDVVGALWSRRGPADLSRTVGTPSNDELFSPADNEWMLTREASAMHPLLRWYSATGDHSPQTLARVPTGLAPRRDRDRLNTLFVPAGVEMQLAIPVRTGVVSESFVLGRSGTDFSDQDLEVARRIQPAFVALDYQVRLLVRLSPVDVGEVAHAVELTGRELAVLRLLAKGHTAVGISLRLSTSPRTVQKHLQHVYRKLDVGDRMAAVRLASELHLITEQPPPLASQR